MTVKSIDKNKIIKRLKKTDKEAYDLVMALENLYNNEREISKKAMAKILSLVKEST